MRLIDVDNELKNLSEMAVDGKTFITAVEYAKIILRNAPTVDAIPIEWIKKYTEENCLYQSDDFDLYISDMIADWAERRKE